LRKKAAETMALVSKYFDGIQPSHVTRSIIHALTASYPLTSYAVGMDARIVLGFLHVIPEQVYNKLVM